MSSDIIPHLCIWAESDFFKATQTDDYVPKTYTMPCIKFIDQLPDFMCYAVESLSSRTPKKLPLVSTNLSGIKTLIANGHLRKALNLTCKLLTDMGQDYGSASQPTKNSYYLFEVWSVRFQLFAALGMYSKLLDELTAFKELNAPDTFLQFYPEYKPHLGSIIPFALRLIHAEALIHSSEPWSAFNRVQRLEENTKKALLIAQKLCLTEFQLNVWFQRLESVQFLKARIFFNLKRYDKAFFIYESILNISFNDELKMKRILAALFRMALAVGSSKRVNQYIEQFSRLKVLESENNLYQSFKAIFYGINEYSQNNVQARNAEKNALKYCNNKAIALLYNGKVEESLNLLCKHQGGLIEPVAINVATITDLTTTSNNNVLKNYFLSHCDDVPDTFNPKLIKIDF